MEDQFTRALIEETKRRLFDEGITRIIICLNKLTLGQIWWRPNEHSNSIGNLTLHLCGNVRQWILSGIGAQEDIRTRDQEFDQRAAIDKEILIDDLHTLEQEVRMVLDQIQPSELLKKRLVQNIYEESALSILIHVVEHFSYHVGQISWITKMQLDIDLGYYEGQDLG